MVAVRGGMASTLAQSPCRRHSGAISFMCRSFCIGAGLAVGGSMSLREQLHAYIAELEKRLRWSTMLRGATLITGSALLATLVLVAIAYALAFSHHSVPIA